MMNLRNREVILRLLEGGLKNCSADEELAREYLRGSHDALNAGLTLVEKFPEIAYEQSHESIRKAFTAFLGMQGLRPSSDAGHHAVVIEAADAQIGHVLGGLVKQALVIKRNRNALQYPQQVTRMSTADAEDALGTAADILRGIESLVTSGIIPVFR